MHIKQSAISAALLSCALALPTAAQADDAWYFSGRVAAQIDDSSARLTPAPTSSFPSVLYEQSPDFSFENGSAFSLALGRQFGSTLAAELELRSSKSKFDSAVLNGSGSRVTDTFSMDGSVRSTSLLLNGLYTLADMGGWKPYLKAGLGVTQHKAEATLSATIGAFGITSPFANPYPSDTRTEFTWAVGLGLGYAITPQWSLDAAYRYIDMGEAITGKDSFGDTINSQIKGHELGLGVSYRF